MRTIATLSLILLLLPASAPRPDAPVADAAMRGEDVETIRALIQQGEDVNAAQGDGMTALHWAAEQGDVEVVEVLIYAGGHVDAVTRLGGYTPLHLASKMGHGPVVAMLLGAGSDPARGTSIGATPLHFAAASGDVTALVALLEHGAEVDARESAWAQTPLMFAAAYDNVEAVETLLERGADASLASDIMDVPARSEKDDADRERRDARLAALQEAEQQDEEEEQDSGASAEQDESGQEQAAAREGGQARERAPAQREGGGNDRRDSEEREDGEDEGAEEQAEEEDTEPLSYDQLIGNKGGLTPLLFAAREGHRDVALRLIERGADINQPSPADQTTPILIATINGHFDLALELLERGADPMLASDAGATPLYAAINVQWAPKAFYPQPRSHLHQETTYLQLMERLLEAGADPNVRLEKHLWYMSYNFDVLQVNTVGATPFWRAAYATDVEAMKLLIAHGADPNVPTRKPPERRRRGRPTGREDDAIDEETDPSGLAPIPVGGPGVWPIHAASGVGYGEGYAANAHRHVPDGWLPAVRYLVEELGADVSARDHNGYNAVHHAAARGDNELILYLVEQGADIMAVSRRGQTTADMANGPVQRISPFPRSVALLESLGSLNNNNCVGC